ncbi:MAG: hypothetical protein P8J17_07075 [Halioglobus sp.]|nr:hypothetical protein [Halioglobus sp.]
MKRLDEGKASLVDFLRSIKFTRDTRDKKSTHCDEHFAGFNPQTPPPNHSSAEDSKLVRSAN